MPNSLSRFKAVVGAGWIVLGLAAIIYARLKGIPGWTALPVAAAFLIEFPCYLFGGFDAPREWLARQSRTRAATLLAISGVLPYLAYSIPTGIFRPLPLVLLLIITVTVSFWYTELPASPLTDAAFLILPVAVTVGRVFNLLYVSPIPRTPLAILGQLMLIRTAALAVVVIRGNSEVEFRFLPHRSEWLTGLKYFALGFPFVAAAYWALGLVDLKPAPASVLVVIATFVATFFGILWVTALSEEFALRGLLLPWITRWTTSFPFALIVTSLLFGSVHLAFQHKYPNWRFATVAAIAGFFYGLAWRSARSIQASMVAHALTATLWKVFFN